MARLVIDGLAARLRQGGALRPELLAPARILALLLLWFGWPVSVPEPFVPLLPVFDMIGSPAAVRAVIRAAALVGAAGLLFDVRPRDASVLLGAAVAAKLLSCRPTYYNNEVFVAAFFLMIGLDTRGLRPPLLRAQLVLLYTGAGLNKLLDPDWRSGQFFEVWTTLEHHTAYLQWKTHLAPMRLSWLFSWATILTELSLAALFCLPRATRPALLLGVAFHSTLVLFAGATFGFFYFALLAAYLALADEITPRVRALATGFIALVGATLTHRMEVTWATYVLAALAPALAALALRRRRVIPEASESVATEH
ncbi:HTTM domain-containing protein [Polyangium sp. 6x1]|uniref:HTTM domain-containing protein n=1 Tax=Polyangium sp. 6x1 TaxID=3042689 RepID=UPI0024822115|nr:HTTM domain-containing protein [Polyangium sp. 6x1]MDI1449843.1 HTTM domain-containing protein [Polyangium sp. 6x1]